MRQSNGSRIMLREELLGQESELKMQRKQLSRSRKLWGRLKMRDWRPHSPSRRYRTWRLLSETVWVILQVPKMGRMGIMRIMQSQSRASWAMMMNRAGWWARSQERYSGADGGLGRSRWSLMNWHNWDGGTLPTNSLRDIRGTALWNWVLRQSLYCKRMIMPPHLPPQHLESICSIFFLSQQYHKYRKGLLDQEVVILG